MHLCKLRLTLKAKGQLVGVLSFCLVGPRDWTQAFRQVSFPTEPSCWPQV